MVVAISGGFDPIHSGHIDLINNASAYGKVVVILNSDDWLVRKKGKYFMNWHERAKILLNIKNVDDVIAVNDKGNSVCDALLKLKPDYFANGGDRKENNTPELTLCLELGIKLLFNIGGNKIQSSSELLNNYAKSI